jgi:hypothetical protein
MTIWRMRIACWIPKATNTHTDCVVIIAFPLQQWLYERASLLRYTYSSVPVLSLNVFPVSPSNTQTVRNTPIATTRFSHSPTE